MAFTQATLQELFLVWKCRSETEYIPTVYLKQFLLFAVITSGVLTAIMAYTGLLGTKSLNLTDWIVVILVSLSGLLIIPEIFCGRKI